MLRGNYQKHLTGKGMKENYDIERAYDLIEQFDFAGLPDADREFILSLMTRDDYEKMRDAVKGVAGIFTEDIEPEEGFPAALTGRPGRPAKGIIKEIFTYPLQLYKVAAGIILLTGIFALHRISDKKESGKMVSENRDTVYMHTTDTVFSVVHDTFRLVVQKSNQDLKGFREEKGDKVIAVTSAQSERKMNFTPGQAEELQNLNCNDNMVKDTLLSEIIVSVNR
jgi:hypothetical protein